MGIRLDTYQKAPAGGEVSREGTSNKKRSKPGRHQPPLQRRRDRPSAGPISHAADAVIDAE